MKTPRNMYKQTMRSMEQIHPRFVHRYQFVFKNCGGSKCFFVEGREFVGKKKRMRVIEERMAG